MTIAICDDEDVFRGKLKEYLLSYKRKHRLQIDIIEFSNGEALLSYDGIPDIVFLDYQMPGINGMGAARTLRARNNICSIIFVTSYPEFMIESFEVNTYRFFIKPIDIKKLNDALDNYIKEKKMFAPVVINVGVEQIVINSEDIIYLEGAGKYCNIRTTTALYRSSKTLSGVYSLLPQHCFFRTHKSYVINLYCVVSIKSDCVILSNGEKAKIGRRSLTEFKNAYKEFVKHFTTRT